MAMKLLVADELVATALQPNSDDAKDQCSGESDHIPVDNRMRPAWRQGQILPAPQSQQGSHDKTLKAKHQKKLAAAPTLIQEFHLIWRQITFFDGEQCIRHCVSWSPVFLFKFAQTLTYNVQPLSY